MSTLQRGKDQGGWGMDNIAVKCKMLLYNRLIRSKEREGAFTSHLMKRWKIDGKITNPPKATRIPHTLPHLYNYAIDMAYIQPSEATETTKALKTRISKVLRIMDNNKNTSPTVRIMKKNPDIPWTRVWKNIHTPGLPDIIKSVWYEAIHDIIPTHQRLATINMVPNRICAICSDNDTLAHRISKCNEGPVIWNWIKARMAAILRVHPTNIPEDWALFPTYTFWPAQKHNAITWSLAHFVYYRLQTQRRQSLKDFLDFLRRARWKVYHHPQRKCQIGRYLEVL
jgi:hypothetical protein